MSPTLCLSAVDASKSSRANMLLHWTISCGDNGSTCKNWVRGPGQVRRIDKGEPIEVVDVTILGRPIHLVEQCNNVFFRNRRHRIFKTRPQCI